MSYHLTFITGPMFSGKSERLIREIIRNDAQYYEGKGLVLKPRLDDRDGSFIKSRALKLQVAAEYAEDYLQHDDSSELTGHIAKMGYNFVYLDEVQFFTVRQLKLILSAARRNGCHVYAAGLSHDFRGTSFESSSYLTDQAHERVQLRATCAKCGSLADFTVRYDLHGKVVSSGVRVATKANYKPACTCCFFESVELRES